MARRTAQRKYKYVTGPWCVSTGQDPFGPACRKPLAFAAKLKMFKKAGYHAVMLHDDETIPDRLPWPQRQRKLRQLRRVIRDHGLVVEHVGARLWDDIRYLDGPVTSNDPKARKWGLDRAKRCVDVCRELGGAWVNFWPAREGTYIREAKDPLVAYQRLLDFLNAMLEFDKEMRYSGEMKPNEPMDVMFAPTPGHWLALAARSIDPRRVGVIIEPAHSLLCNLDPSEDMALALSLGALYSVHLNDQNGLKFDQDKTFGSASIRMAFNVVWTLERANYGSNGEMIAFDIQPQRTQPEQRLHQHLVNNIRIFEALLEKVRSLDLKTVEALRAARDHDGLDLYIMQHLLGLRKRK